MSEIKKMKEKKEMKESKDSHIRFGIQARIVTYILLLSIIPLLISNIILVTQSQTTVTNEWNSKMLSIATNKESQIESWFDQQADKATEYARYDYIRNLTLEANDWGSSEINRNSSRTQIEELLRDGLLVNDQINFAYILNSSGYVIAENTLLDHSPVSLGLDLSNTEYYSAVSGNKSNYLYQYFGDMRRTIVSGYSDLIFTVAAPIFKFGVTSTNWVTMTASELGDNFIGVVVLALNEDFVTQIFQDTQGLGNTGEAYLVNAKLEWMTESSYPENFPTYTDIDDTLLEEKIIQTGAKEALSSMEIVQAQNPDYRGVSVLGVYYPMDLTSDSGKEWVLVVEIDTAEALAQVNFMQTLMFIIIGIAAAAVIFAGYMVGNTISKPILGMHEYVGEMAGDNLSHEFEFSNSYETGELAEDLNQLHRHLEDMIMHDREMSHRIDDAASNLVNAADEVTASSENIASSQQQISKGSSNQVAQIADVHHKVEELTKGVHNIREHIDDIGKIANLIENIANQTNMLALNAAIEAARAGEAGRGFNVVADQVRKLADESSRAVMQTNKMLQEIQNITHVQEEHADDIVKAVVGIENIAEETSASTEEAASAAEEQVSAMETIDRIAHHLLDIADKLEKEFAHFRLSDRVEVEIERRKKAIDAEERAYLRGTMEIIEEDSEPKEKKKAKQKKKENPESTIKSRKEEVKKLEKSLESTGKSAF